ncbi:hypothetical protein AVEN_263551-1 [Araneus ventricosus]|uniref:Uncharacterized protein n=1 Tax=Araneus ventricosus TaxID=182803 RepID=A0A4Y2JYI5_ARAVE|nr:hypothetical protein AVEN_263551-1 [Araneus ventricosus]
MGIINERRAAWHAVYLFSQRISSKKTNNSPLFSLISVTRDERGADGQVGGVAMLTLLTMPLKSREPATEAADFLGRNGMDARFPSSLSYPLFITIFFHIMFSLVCLERANSVFVWD